jgi:hypothetical protein
MVKVFQIAALAGLSVVSAHNNAVCSCTDSDLPGQVSFYYGTYHGAGEASAGQVNIMQAGNSVPLTTAFVNAQPGNNANTATATIADDLKASYGYGASVTCVCYGNSGTETTAPAGTVLATPITSASMASRCGGSSASAWFKATVENAKSGAYRLWTEGTNMVLDPYGTAGSVCKPGTGVKVFIPFLEVASVGGPCAGNPPGYGATGPANSLGYDAAECKDKNSGAGCTLTCMPGFFASGKTECIGTLGQDVGTWEASFACSDTEPCSAETAPFAVAGAGCALYTASGTSCSRSCAPEEISDGTISCNNKVWSASTAVCKEAPVAYDMNVTFAGGKFAVRQQTDVGVKVDACPAKLADLTTRISALAGSRSWVTLGARLVDPQTPATITAVDDIATTRVITNPGALYAADFQCGGDFRAALQEVEVAIAELEGGAPSATVANVPRAAGVALAPGSVNGVVVGVDGTELHQDGGSKVWTIPLLSSVTVACSHVTTTLQQLVDDLAALSVAAPTTTTTTTTPVAPAEPVGTVKK